MQTSASDLVHYVSFIKRVALITSEGSDDDTVLAALLHDVGQFLPLDAAKDVQMGMGDHSVGRVGHETIGEEYLKGLGFGESVSRLVGSHVAAKR